MLWHQYPIIAQSGDWDVHYCAEYNRFSVGYYGNFKGWHDSIEAVMKVIPGFLRGSIWRQLSNWEAQTVYGRIKVQDVAAENCSFRLPLIMWNSCVCKSVMFLQ